MYGVYLYIHISSPNLNFNSPFHPDLSMKLPCCCAILVGSLTTGSRFSLNNGIRSVSLRLEGFSEFAGVFAGCFGRCFVCVCWVYKEKGLRITVLKDTSQQGTKKMFFQKLSKMSFLNFPAWRTFLT